MTPAGPPPRLTAVDALRGAVMVVMALDHTRDFLHAGAMTFSPEDLARTTPLLFLTRWVTHICAPTFVFLAGMGAFLRLQRDGSPAELSRFLWTRGVWLVLLELTVMRLAVNFSLSLAYPLLLLVLTALGLSMIGMAALTRLPRRVLLAGSIAVILLHNLLDGVQASQFGAYAGLWNLLHQQGVVLLGGIVVVVGYPLIPWIAVMALAFTMGPLLLRDEAARRRTLLAAGAAMTAAFVVLRAANVYGDPSPWSPQASPAFTAISFLRTTKYPPSLLFLLMTLGPALMALAWLDRSPGRLREALAVVGRVPLFFYVLHFWGCTCWRRPWRGCGTARRRWRSCSRRCRRWAAPAISSLPAPATRCRRSTSPRSASCSRCTRCACGSRRSGGAGASGGSATSERDGRAGPTSAVDERSAGT
jgi:uncharacterized membrane protein